MSVTTTNEFFVIKHPMGYGYTIAHRGPEKPSWMLRDHFSWFKRKGDAIKRVQMLNQTK